MSDPQLGSIREFEGKVQQYQEDEGIKLWVDLDEEGVAEIKKLQQAVQRYMEIRKMGGSTDN